MSHRPASKVDSWLDRHGNLLDLVRSFAFTAAPLLTVTGAVFYLSVGNQLGTWLTAVYAIVAFSLSLVTDLPPKFRAMAIAYKEQVALSMGSLFTLPILVSALRDPHALASTPAGETFVFILEGVAVGFILRRVGGRALSMEIFGRPRNRQRMYLAFAIALLILLLPASKTHKNLDNVYLLGVAAGLLAHDLFRRHEAAQAEYERVRRNVRKLVSAPGEETGNVPEDFIVAENYLAYRQIRRLRDHLSTFRRPNTWMIVIEVCMLRYLGQYANAVTRALGELERDKRERSLDQTLHLLLSLNYSELGQEALVAKHLKAALALDRECPIGKLTLALRMIESPEVAKEFPAQNPLQLVREATASIETTPQKPEAKKRAIARSVPLGHTFLMDAYGYALLHSGQLETSRALLTLCIYEDPHYSGAYLHLGEWMLHMADLAASAGAEPATIAFFDETTRFLLEIAIGLERKRESLIKRRAKALLSGTRPQ